MNKPKISRPKSPYLVVPQGRNSDRRLSNKRKSDRRKVKYELQKDNTDGYEDNNNLVCPVEKENVRKKTIVESDLDIASVSTICESVLLHERKTDKLLENIDHLKNESRGAYSNNKHFNHPDPSSLDYILNRTSNEHDDYSKEFISATSDTREREKWHWWDFSHSKSNENQSSTDPKDNSAIISKDVPLAVDTVHRMEVEISSSKPKARGPAPPNAIKPITSSPRSFSNQPSKPTLLLTALLASRDTTTDVSTEKCSSEGPYFSRSDSNQPTISVSLSPGRPERRPPNTMMHQPSFILPVFGRDRPADRLDSPHWDNFKSVPSDRRKGRRNHLSDRVAALNSQRPASPTHEPYEAKMEFTIDCSEEPTHDNDTKEPISSLVLKSSIRCHDVDV